jgi:hypothetical protein
MANVERIAGVTTGMLERAAAAPSVEDHRGQVSRASSRLRSRHKVGLPIASPMLLGDPALAEFPASKFSRLTLAASRLR